MKKLAFILIFIFGFVNVSFGYTLLESSFYGNQQPALSARSLGMGGCGISLENSGSALFRNPATMTLMENIHFSANLSIMRAQEDISRKVFDSFDNTIGDATYASNTNYYTQPTFISGVLPFGKLGWTDQLSIGLAFSRNYDFSYDYEEIFYDEEYEEDYKIDYSIEGYLNDYAFGISGKPHKALSVGLAFHYLSGKKEFNLKNVDIAMDEETKNEWQYKDVTGTQFSFGALFQPLNFARRLSIGIYGKTSAEVKGDYFDDEEREITYPDEFGFGVTYLPQNEIPSLLSCDMILKRWSKLEDSFDEELELDDVIELHVGLEHILFEDFPVRTGFYWQPTSYDKENSQISFSLGGGYHIEQVKFDLGVEIGKRKFYAGDIAHHFQDVFTLLVKYEETPIIQDFKIEETQMRLMATFSYEL